MAASPSHLLSEPTTRPLRWMADYLKAAHAVQMEMIYVFGGILAENKALLKTRFQSYFLNIAPTGKTFS